MRLQATVEVYPAENFIKAQGDVSLRFTELKISAQRNKEGGKWSQQQTQGRPYELSWKINEGVVTAEDLMVHFYSHLAQRPVKIVCRRFAPTSAMALKMPALKSLYHPPAGLLLEEGRPNPLRAVATEIWEIAGLLFARLNPENNTFHPQDTVLFAPAYWEQAPLGETFELTCQTRQQEKVIFKLHSRMIAEKRTPQYPGLSGEMELIFDARAGIPVKIHSQVHLSSTEEHGTKKQTIIRKLWLKRSTRRMQR